MHLFREMNVYEQTYNLVNISTRNPKNNVLERTDNFGISISEGLKSTWMNKIISLAQKPNI